MMDKKYEGTGFVVVGFIIGCCLMWAIMQSIHVQKKYSMNLKCVQGELYEEIRPNFYVKSHLECFEAKDILMALPFTYAVVDDDGEVLRKYRWNAKEAKWHKEQGSNVIKLEVVKEVKEDVMSLVGDCLF
jgi:hypothetical protein